MKKILALSLVATFIPAFAAEPVEEWIRTFDEGTGWNVAVDSEGNVYVVGETGSGGDRDALIIKYDSDGNKQWHKTFAGEAADGDYFFDVAVDDDDDIYAAGMVVNDNEDLLIVKYTPDGDSVWVRILDTSLPPVELYEDAHGIAVDANYVYVTGKYRFNDVGQARTMIYDKDNDYIRGDNFDDPDEYDVGRAIAVDDEGYVYVAGGTGPQPGDDFLIIKYDSLLDTVWTRIHNPGTYDLALGIALDEDGYVYVAGYPGGGGGGLYVVRYDNDGNLDGTQNHAPYDYQRGYDVAVSGDNVYLAGYKEEGGSPKDVLTICYDREWNLKWEKDYDSGNHENGSGIAVDNQGYLYVIGSVNISGQSDVLTIKYRLPGEITVTWPNGGEQLVIGSSYPVTWDTEGVIDSVMLEFTNESVVGLDTIAVVANTGTYMWTVPDNPGTQTRLFISDLENYSDVRDASDADFSIVAEAVEEVVSTSLFLAVSPDGLIHYSVPGFNDASIKIYAVDGSMVYSKTITSPKGELRCDALVSGIYFVRLVADRESIIRKGILTR